MAFARYEIPLSPSPQRFSVALSGVTYQLTFKWNRKAGVWVMDMADSQGVAVVQGIPLVTGSDLLEQFAYLGFVGQLHVQTDHAPDVTPTFENLGETSHLYYSVAQ